MIHLKRIINNSDTKAGKVFDFVIQALIVCSMITFSLSTLPKLSPTQEAYLELAEVFFVLLFTLEYLLRVWAAENKKDYVLSFFGLVDLLSILPFYLSLGVDLRSLRAARLIRLFRILKLARYNEAIRRFHVAFRLVKEEFTLFFFAAMIFLYFSAVGIYYFENPVQPTAFSSVFDSLWWATATLTTVGYGDVYPITMGGKIFTFVILFIGLGIIAIPTGIFASALAKAREILQEEKENSAGN